MREIKFRGKSLSGKWVYGDLVHFTNTEGVDASVIITEHQATTESDDFDYALCYARNEFKIVVPDSVGQFTGLHDKNGKEIYEGDIVVLRRRMKNISNIQTIEWCSHIAAFVRVIDGMDAHFISEADMDLYEVIGNIHDNPELLKTE